MSTKAFNTRRVIESLSALSDYLDQAVQTADGISPGEVPDINLPETPPESVSPRLISVLYNGSRKIELPDDEATTLDLTVSGDDLQEPALFKLVGVGPNVPTITSEVFPSKADDQFTVTITFPEHSAGLYDAKFVNTAGQQDVLNRAVRVKKARDDNGNGDGNGGGADVDVEAKAAKKGRAARG